MPTVHSWKPYASGFLYGPAQYSDGTAFAPGDTLVFNDGAPSTQSASAGVASLTTGTYQFNVTGASASLLLVNELLDGASAINVAGPGTLTWTNKGQFVNAGTIQVGSATTSGTLTYNLFGDGTSNAAAFTNSGTVAVQNNSLMLINPGAISSNGGTVFNAVGGVMDVGSGSVLKISTPSGYASGSTIDGAVRNDGLITVGGAGPAGPKAFLILGTTYDGIGLVSVRGTPGTETPPDTRSVVGGPASGTFDVASGKVEFDGRANTATVN